jgi:hypothetical protein
MVRFHGRQSKVDKEDPRPHYRYVEPLARTLLLQGREHDATSAGRRGEYDVLELSSRPGEAMNEPYRRS